MKIVIDPGHGGRDPGTCANGLVEAHVNLDIARAAALTLKEEYSGTEVLMTRTGDTYTTLAERVTTANRWPADLFLSIHSNAGGGTGLETFRAKAAPQKTKAIHEAMHAILADFYERRGLKDRGPKTKDYYVLRKTTMPAILIETLFIDNHNDAEYLQDEQFRRELGQAIARAVAKTLGLTPTTTKLYKVQVGAFANRANAEALVSRLKKAGFDAIIVAEPTSRTG